MSIYADPFFDPAIFSPINNTKNVYGPRLAERNVQYSSYGSVIPITFGVRKLTGNVIWCAPLDELEFKDKDIQRPGSSGTASLDLPGLNASQSPPLVTITHEYYYFADFAVSFGYGDPTNPDKVILRIKADGKLIYDARDPNAGDGDLFYQAARTPVSFFETLQFKFYAGTPDQLPDETIMSYENPRYAEEHSTDPAVNVVPAYRNMQYIVFKKFPVTPFNNNIPYIEIELADVSSFSNEVETYTDFISPGSWVAESSVVDWNNLLLYTTDGTHIRTVDLTTLTMISEVAVIRVADNDFPDAVGNAIASLDISRASGQLYAMSVLGEKIQIFSVNPYTGICTPMGHYGGRLKLGPYSASYTAPTRIIVTSYISTLGTLQDEVILSEASGGTKLFSSESGSEPFLINHYIGGGLREAYTPGEIGNNFGVFYYNFNNVIWRFQGGTATNFASGVGVSFFQYISQQNALLICYDDGVNATMVLRDVQTGTIIWTSPSIGGGFASLDAAPLWKIDTRSYQMLFLRGGAYTILDMTNGKLIKAANLAYPASTPMGSGRFKAIFGAKDYIFIDRVVANRTSLGEFLRFAGRLAHIDVDSGSPQLVVDTVLDDIIIDGAMLNEVNVSFRRLADNLRQAFLFDIRESEGHILMTKRAVGNFTNDFSFYVVNMLKLDDSSGVSLEVQRREDDGIPVRLSYHFLDYTRDYEENIVFAQRSGNTFSKNTADITIPIIMRLSEAKVWAYKVLYTLWNTRESYSVRVDFGELRTEPSDVGIVNNDGRIYRVKIESLTYNSDYSISAICSNYVDDSDITIAADAPLGNIPALQYFSPTGIAIFDIPNAFPNESDFYRDGHMASILIIASPDVPSRPWNGALAYMSTIYGNGNYSFTRGAVETQLIGVTLSKLTDVSGTEFSIDDASTLDVRVSPSLTLATITDDEFFSGVKNCAAVKTSNGGAEIVVFRDATDLGSNTYRLSHFLRGRRGTDYLVSNHIVSSIVLFLIPGMQASLPVEPRARDTQLTVKANTLGRDTLSTTVHADIDGKTQLPYQPNGLKCVRAIDGAITFTWLPRTRAPAALTFVEDAPEAILPTWETVQKYELYFPLTGNSWVAALDADDDGVVDYDHVSVFDDATDLRGPSGLKTTLTLAQQTAIFGGTMAATDRVQVAIYQHSGEWGRGVGKVHEVYIT